LEEGIAIQFRKNLLTGQLVKSINTVVGIMARGRALGI
jgi:hypothetical protein